MGQGGYLPTSRAEPCGFGEVWSTARPAGARPCFGYFSWPVPQPDQPGGPEEPALPPPLDFQDPDPPKNRITSSLLGKVQRLHIKENLGFLWGSGSENFTKLNLSRLIIPGRDWCRLVRPQGGRQHPDGPGYKPGPRPRPGVQLPAHPGVERPLQARVGRRGAGPLHQWRRTQDCPPVENKDGPEKEINTRLTPKTLHKFLKYWITKLRRGYIFLDNKLPGGQRFLRDGSGPPPGEDTATSPPGCCWRWRGAGACPPPGGGWS